jgi:hypothetical protein
MLPSPLGLVVDRILVEITYHLAYNSENKAFNKRHCQAAVSEVFSCHPIEASNFRMD